MFKRIVFWNVMACMLAGAGTAWAGTEASGTTLPAQNQSLTFEAALAQAAGSNRTYLMQLEREHAAQARLHQSLLAFGPTGTLQAGYVLENKPQTMTIDFGGALGAPGSAPQEIPLSTNYYSGQIAVSQPLFTGGKLLNACRLAGLQYESAQDSTLLAQGQLVLDMTQAFYGVLVTEKLLGVMEDSLAQMNRHLDVVKARYREGSASNYDLLRSEVQVANFEPAVIKNRNALILARRNLAASLGMEALGNSLPVTGTLAAAEEPWAPLEDLKAGALSKRRDLKNISRSLKMAEISHSLALWSNSPQVALTGAWTYYDTHDETFPPEGAYLKHAWQVGIGLTWPFWDNLSFWPKAGEASARVREAELGQKAMEDGVLMEVESAYLALTTAYQTLKAQQKNAELAERGYRLAEEQYANGLMTNLDVLDAQLALNQAQSNYLQTQYDCLVARVKLHRAVGDSFELGK